MSFVELAVIKHVHQLIPRDVRELEGQLKSLETEHRQLKQEATALRRQNVSLDEEYHGKSKSGTFSGRVHNSCVENGSGIQTVF